MTSRIAVVLGALITCAACGSAGAPTAPASEPEQITSTPVVLTRARAHVIAVAATDWRAQHAAGACPSVADLKASRDLDPLADDLDAWGHALAIVCTATTTTVSSTGPDGTPASADDVADAPTPLSKPLSSGDTVSTSAPVSATLTQQGDPATISLTNFVQTQVRPKVRACIDDAVKKDPRVSGALAGTIVVAPDGTVRKVSLTGGGLPDPVLQCAAAAIQSVKFDPSPDKKDRFVTL